MSPLTDHPATLALGSTLLHFLWQGTVLGLTAFAILRFFHLRPETRYTVGVIALAVMLAAPVATFSVQFSRESASRHSAADTPGRAMSSPVGSVPGASAAPFDSSTGLNSPVRQANDPSSTLSLPKSTANVWSFQPSTIRALLLSVWLTGVVVLSLRLLGGWIVARRLAARAIRPVAPEIQSLARRVAGRLALDRAVRVVESTAVSVPAMIGWFKPVVLLPAAALAGLTPGQIEALIAHELAHVRRHDYLVNLLQTAVETLLFYHPAVWWMSRQVRADREHCCDDLAVGVCDRLTYVTALASLAAMTSRPRLALAATGGSLLGRVRRILGQPAEDHGGGSGWLAGLAIVTIAAAVVATTALAGPSRDAQNREDGSAAAAKLPVAAESAASMDEQRAAEAGEASAQARTEAAAIPLGGLQEAVAVAVAQNAQTAGAAELEQLRRALESVGAAQEERAREARERALEQLLQMDAKEYQRLLEMKRAIDRERIELERRTRDVQYDARISVMEGELQAAHQALERVRTEFEKGLVDRSVVAQVEAKVQAVQSQLAAVKAERDLLKLEIELKLRESEVMRDSERRRMELDRALREKMVEPGGELSEMVKRIRDLEALLQAREAGRADQQAREIPRTEAVSNPNEPVRAGDVLVIEIAGEPDLPRNYEVRTDGTIRLPLIGSVRVAGSTVRQVREAVSKQITDRGLGSSPGVAVALRRPRGGSEESIR